MSTRERWLSAKDNELSLELLNELLSSDSDELWIAAAAADRLVDDIPIQRAILSAGIRATEGAVERLKSSAYFSTTKDSTDDEDETSSSDEGDGSTGHVRDVDLVRIRLDLLRRRDLVDTYEAISKENAWNSLSDGVKDDNPAEDPWEAADAWDEDADPQASTGKSIPSPPVTLSEFLSSKLQYTALNLASSRRLEALRMILKHHAVELFPYRFRLMEAIPEHVHPSEYQDLLPSIDFGTNREPLPTETRWRTVLDWTETAEGQSILNGGKHRASEKSSQTTSAKDPLCAEPLSAAELAEWYRSRVEEIDSISGMVDVALALVQYGTAQGVPDLDELGEDLSLLTRLIYDTTGGGTNDTGDWTLERWKSLDSLAVVKAYLSGSTPATVAKDIKRLVLPYLFTMEARLERAGRADPSLSTRILHEYILSAPLHLSSAIFEASKLTIPIDQRIIKTNEDVARLALACLYGSEALDQWSTMSRIYECMPSWDKTEASEDEKDEADTTLSSLAAFVTPSATRPRCTPSDLFLFFAPLPAAALSRALDVLDVHLESGEIMARWNVPAPLRWFLQSANDKAEQRVWATRMARRVVDDNEAEAVENEAEWTSLMDNMLKLVGHGQGPLRGAFGLLTKEEVSRIFFGGLLSAGRFELAKSLLKHSKGKRRLAPTVIEELCLTASREFFDNATSGNLHFGDMKLAYDCLSVSPNTSAIRKEREFVEATSRICSYHVYSRPGILITPLEIRLVKDRLSLVGRVLSSTEDVYKHPEVILDLVDKLGFRGDIVAEVKALAMISDSALQSEDFRAAVDICDRMIQKVITLPKDPSADDTNQPDHVSGAHNQAIEVCWHTCYQLGRQPEFQDTKKKLSLLSYALQLCPPENMLDVLTVWRKVEGEAVRSRVEKPPVHGNGSSATRKRNPMLSPTSSLVSQLPNFRLPSASLASPDAAAISRTFNRVAASFPFNVGGRHGGSEDESSTRSRSPDVSSHARQALARGVGWLIGTNDDDEQG